MLSGIPLFPEQASNLAPAVDNLYFFVPAVTAFCALLVAICVVVFAIRYRDRTGDRGLPLRRQVSTICFARNTAGRSTRG